MALYSPFKNYIWNLSVAIAMESGGRIGVHCGEGHPSYCFN